MKVPVLENVLEKLDGGTELKDVGDREERDRLLKEHMVLKGKHDMTDKNVLLIDDVYRSGQTVNVATNVLYAQARVKNVFVLTMTKTRRKR